MSRQGRTASGCPCGSGVAYSRCCAPLHRREHDAATAEELMRSRYSAFAKRLDSYLAHSWHPSTAPESIRCRDGQHWTELEILDVAHGGPLDDTGEVEFVASYELDGRPGRLHERSRFVRHEGRWVYLDGDIDT